MRSYLFILTLVLAAASSQAASVIHNQDGTVGSFLSSTGSVLTSGGVSIGYFPTTVTTPTDAAIQGLSASTAYADLLGLGYVDVRNIPGSSAEVGTTFDWNYGGISGSNPTDISGSWTFTAGSHPLLPSGTQLYVFAFNAGTFLSGFAGSTEWAAVRDPQNTSRTGALARIVNLSNVDGTAGEVLVGTDSGVNVNLAAVPEPSRALLGMIGLVALFVRRRR